MPFPGGWDCLYLPFTLPHGGLPHPHHPHACPRTLRSSSPATITLYFVPSLPPPSHTLPALPCPFPCCTSIAHGLVLACRSAGALCPPYPYTYCALYHRQFACGSAIVPYLPCITPSITAPFPRTWRFAGSSFFPFTCTGGFVIYYTHLHLSFFLPATTYTCPAYLCLAVILTYLPTFSLGLPSLALLTWFFPQVPLPQPASVLPAITVACHRPPTCACSLPTHTCPTTYRYSQFYCHPHAYLPAFVILHTLSAIPCACALPLILPTIHALCIVCLYPC